MTLVVDPATEDVMAAVRRLAASSPYTKGFPGRFIAQDMDRYLERRWIGVALDGDEVVGYIVIRPQKQKPYANLHWMGVAAERRRSGVGSALLAYAWRENPHNELRLHVDASNEDAVTFYRRHGFQEYTLVSQPGGDELLMVGRRPR